MTCGARKRKSWRRQASNLAFIAVFFLGCDARFLLFLAWLVYVGGRKKCASWRAASNKAQEIARSRSRFFVRLQPAISGFWHRKAAKAAANRLHSANELAEGARARSNNVDLNASNMQRAARSFGVLRALAFVAYAQKRLRTAIIARFVATLVVIASSARVSAFFFCSYVDVQVNLKTRRCWLFCHC